MTKLNQIIAVEAGVKARANDAVTATYHKIQKPDLFAGISRTYDPLDDEGERFPDESTRVQLTTPSLLDELTVAWSRLLDVTATKDVANTQALADVTLADGTVILTQVPVSYLIWFEKQLTDLRTLVSKLPTLDPASDWTLDDAAGTDVYQTPTVKTHKTKKVLKNHEKAPATAEHPAQVEVFTEDVIVGYWSTVKFSGAVTQARVQQLVARVEELQRAVKFAREAANELEVTDVRVGGPIFDYLLAN